MAVLGREGIEALKGRGIGKAFWGVDEVSMVGTKVN